MGVVCAHSYEMRNVCRIDEKFRPFGSQKGLDKKFEIRRFSVPQHRYVFLKAQWIEIYDPITSYLKLNIRMNFKSNKVEIKNKSGTFDYGPLQRAVEFVNAFILGFDIQDAIS